MHPIKLRKRHRFPRRLAGWGVSASLILVAIGSGCSQWNLNRRPDDSTAREASADSLLSRIAPQKKPAAAPAKKLDISGRGLLLGDIDSTAFDEGEFAQTLRTLFQERKLASADYLVQTYPDIAMALLLHGACTEFNQDECHQLGQLLDQRWFSTVQPGPCSEYALAAARPVGPDGQTFAQMRLRWIDLLTNDRLDQARRLGLRETAKQIGSELAQLETSRMEATGHLVKREYEQAIRTLHDGIERCGDRFPYPLARMYLLLAEACRHANQQEQWLAAWQNATLVESKSLASTGWSDPAFWKRAAFQRPIQENWPEAVADRFRKQLEPAGLVFPQAMVSEPERESIVWALIGMQSLRRHESQNALLALKKAEALATDPRLKQELLMQQAVAMIDGGQAGPASPVLVRLSSRTGSISGRARAVLGALKLQHGSLDQGMNLLKSSMRETDEWPQTERLKAQADYGLALLIQGREEEGLATLESVCESFARLGLFSHAVQCLANQVEYFDGSNQPDRLATARERLAQFQRDGQLTVSTSHR